MNILHISCWTLVISAIWGVNQEMKDLSLCLFVTTFQINKQISFYKETICDFCEERMQKCLRCCHLQWFQWHIIHNHLKKNNLVCVLIKENWQYIEETIATITNIPVESAYTIPTEKSNSRRFSAYGCQNCRQSSYWTF